MGRSLPTRETSPSLTTVGNKPKQWDAWNIDADFEDKHWDLDKADEVKLVESGPLRAVIRIKNHFQNSTFVRDVTLYAGVPRLDVKMQAEWHEKHILLKVAVPVSARSDKAAYEIPFGSVERPTTRNTPAEKAQFEVPAQRWADISDGKHGLSLLNDSKYGYDAKGNVLRLSLLRSPESPDPHADEGHHEFTYSFYPHDGGWKDALTIRRGYELNYKLMALPTARHQGALPPDGFTVLASRSHGNDAALAAFLQGRRVAALRHAGSSLKLGLLAAGEADLYVTLQLPPGAQSASETDLMERRLSALQMDAGQVKVPTKPFEIKTVMVQFSDLPNIPTKATAGQR